ncbi:MoaD/ThiS family protein [Tissierella creatinophila]|uniref:ThiS family protein n=1 Tax=Tissierella creatinophila DSM 6911 TaxID=1123403 RepID=A0A1U7M8X4_TISCR|nr:MoaD/ThiS family protein [Tissierella creatinophila]OLS03735.1 ThiS family protein [Tissierella creatinophila DSM 6911]
MIKIEVRLFATFRENRERKYFFELPKETNILDILNKLNIDREDASLILLNGVDGDVDRKLKDGDVLSLFPPVGGG